MTKAFVTLSFVADLAECDTEAAEQALVAMLSAICHSGTDLAEGVRVSDDGMPRATVFVHPNEA